MIEVGAKAALAHQVQEILVGGRHNAHVRTHRVRAPQLLEGVLLEEPQQLGLHLQGEVADFIEEQGPGVRELHAADRPGIPAARRAADWRSPAAACATVACREAGPAVPRPRAGPQSAASANAGRAKRKNGRPVAVCMRATRMGEGTNEVISHTAPTPCLHVPRFEATDTIHRARKRGCCSGLQTDEVSISGRDYGRTLPQDDGNDHAGTTAAGIPVHPTFLPTSGPQRSLGHGLGGRLRGDARLNYVRSRGLVVRLLAGHVARD